MDFSIDNPEGIYNKINDELTIIVNSIKDDSTNEELNHAQAQAKEQLGKLQEELQKHLSELQRNAEWNTFTIAFYGETGAGKSTLIETLRIMLQESTKIESQKKYRQAYSEYVKCVDSIKEIDDDLQRIINVISQIENSFEKIVTSYDESHYQIEKEIKENEMAADLKINELTSISQLKKQVYSELITEIEKIKESISNHKKLATLWQKFIFLFKALPEEKVLRELEQQFPKITADYEQSIEKLNTQKLTVKNMKQVLFQRLSNIQEKYHQEQIDYKENLQQENSNKQQLIQKRSRLQEKVVTDLEILTRCADGMNIGDGSPDFTLNTKRYDFNLNGYSFALLDVPGIEGKEGLVLEQIENAVQKAHAVFYLTNKAAPPQTGDEERKGTLEKIKMHLGAQTEVWSIFNKKITNPKHTLKNRPLISEDECAALEDLDEKMSEHLGKHYQKVFSLTALPAFVSSTDCFPPSSRFYKYRTKFLKDFDVAELLECSGVNGFLKMLESKILPDSKNKINLANIHKAGEAVKNLRENLDGIERTYCLLSDELVGTSNSAKQQLESSFSILNTRADNSGLNIIRQFKSRVRDTVYSEIDKNISNDQFKHVLNKQIKINLNDALKKIPEAIQVEMGNFQEDTKIILQRFEEQVQDLVQLSTKFNSKKFNHDFEIKVDIDNGINVKALLGALLGAVLIPFTGGASMWVAAGAALSAVIAVGKAVMGFFSSKYKMSQQRESVDDNLYHIGSEMECKFREVLLDVMTEVENTLKELKAILNSPITQVQATTDLLKNSNMKLDILLNEIRCLGDL